jgi:alpha-1,6-mannosyltransferase
MSATVAPPLPRLALSRGRRAAGAAALAVIVGGGVLIAVSGVGAPRFLGGVRGLPGWTRGLLPRSAVHITAAQFYLVLGAMAAAYGVALACAERLPVRWIVGAIAVLHVAFVLAPPLLSTDVFSYIEYGRLGAVHGLDPYTTTPAAVHPHDAVYRYVHWRHTRSAYGPLFTLGSYPLALLGPGGALAAFKLLAAAASLGCTGVLWRLAGRLGRPRATAIAAFGLNPVLLVYTVGGGHNDALMLLGMLGAVALVVGSRELAGGALLATAVAIKASAGLAIPFLVLGARRRWWALAGVAVGAAAMAALAWVAFPDHAAGMIAVLRHEQHLVAHDSVPNVVAHALGLPGVTAPLRLAFQALFAASAAVLVVCAWRGADLARTCGWAFVALVATATWFLAWYTVWPLAFAALARDRRLLLATLALQVFYVVNHLPLG